MYLLGFDVGSSSIKATVMDGEKGTVLATKTSPEIEMEIIARKPGWAAIEAQGTLQAAYPQGYDLLWKCLLHYGGGHFHFLLQ